MRIIPTHRRQLKTPPQIGPKVTLQETAKRANQLGMRACQEVLSEYLFCP